MITPKHEVTIIVDGVEIRGWDSYQIRTSITDPADMFELRRPFDREVWDRCREDRTVKVLIDRVPIITGFIDEREPPDDNTLVIRGRCRIGRLYDDDSETLQLGGLGMKDMITKIATPFPFAKVTFDATRDRAVRRGKGKKVRAGASQALTLQAKKATAAVEPGQKRWQIIEQLLEQAHLLAWSSGDGTELIVATPNYTQQPQFRFFRPAPGSKRGAESNVISLVPRLSVGDRYSRIIVVGSGPGTSVNFGAAVLSRFGDARNSFADVDGVGQDFTAPKRLVVQATVSSKDEADEVAEYEMAKRDASGDVVTVRAPGHGQVIAGTTPTLFACDLLAIVEDERTGIKDTYTITACEYSQTRGGGPETTMTLVPRGTVLA